MEGGKQMTDKEQLNKKGCHKCIHSKMNGMELICNLKEDYKELEQRHNEAFQEFERLKIECEELKDFARREGNQREIYYKEFLRIKSALEEIKEYCNNVLSFTATRTTEIDILNIINEVKEEK